MIINFVIINGVDMTAQVKTGLSLSFRIDVELDSGSIILPYTDNPTPYTPYTPVFISIATGGLYSYYIESDQVTTIGTNPIKYQHAITLIEPTKILEKYTINNMTFTQPIIEDVTNPPYTLQQAIQRIIDNYPLRVQGASGKIVDMISTDLQNKLTGIKAPEITIRQTTMREAIDRLLSYVNAIARIKIDYNTGAKILEADYYDTLINLISNSTGTNITKVRTGDAYAQSGTLNLDNATQQYSTVNHPGGNALAGVRSTDPVVNDQNLLFILPYPIYEIEEFNVYCKVNEYSDDLFQTYLGTYEKKADISAFILEKQLWDALPEPSTSLQNEGKKHKMNTLYYTRGDNKIYNIGGLIKTSGFQFLYDRTIDAILSLTVPFTNDNAARIKWAAGTIPGTVNQASFLDLLFNARYRTIINTKVRAHRDIKDDFLLITDTPLSQADNLIDLELMGNNARGTINKIGNEDMTITKRVANWDDRFIPGQYTTDGYIVTNSDNLVFKDFVQTTAYLTKNYNGLSKFVGVDQEVRQIPLPLQTTPTRLYYEQFIHVSSNLITPPPSENQNFMTSSFVTTYSNYLKPTGSRSYTLLTKLFETNSHDANDDYTGGRVFKTPSGVINDANLVILVTPAQSNSSVAIRLYDLDADSTSYVQWERSGAGSYTIVITANLLPSRNYRIVMRRTFSGDANTDDYTRVLINYIPNTLLGKYHGLFQGRQQFYGGLLLNMVGTGVDISNFNNSFKFDFKFDSNRFAGTNTQISDLLGVPTLVRTLNQVPYADKHGRLIRFYFKIGTTVEKGTYYLKALEGRIYPLMDNADFDNFIVSTPEFSYNKDSGEELQMTYQVNHVVTDNDKDAIILGKFLLTKMFKFEDLNDAGFKIWASTTEYYGRNDTSKAKGTKLSSTTPYTVTASTSSQPYRIAITPNVTLTSYTSWAIANENGDLILAVNRINPKTQQNTNVNTIYLTFTDKR